MTSLSGWLALLLLALCALSGALLAWHFSPAEAGAYASVVSLEQAVRGGAALRALHFLSTQLALGLALVHFLAVLVRRAEPRERMAVGFASGLAALGLTGLGAFSGRVLPWDQHGGLSLVMLREFLRVGPLDPLGGLVGEAGLRVARVFLLHLLGTVLLGVALGVHLVAPARARLRAWLDGRGRAVGLTTAAALALVLAASAFMSAPLGEPFAPAQLAGEPPVAAEWYLRWLQFLSLRSLPLARVALAAALALVLAAPLYVRRLGPRGLRVLFGGALLVALVTSLLPARPA
jgi:quinol-cytochrome oxidoreductase complex cytochrome b subunit